MLSAQKIVEEPLLVSRPTDINGSLFQDAIVQRNCSLHIHGNLRGSLTIESGASVIVEGSVDGRVVNKGGKLVINNRGIAEYARAEGPAEAEARGILKVNLNAIATNWETLARHTEAECAASLPADAYGLGAEPIAGTLAEVGCKTFFVSDLGEARRVRGAASKATIYVLNGLYAGTAPAFAEINARPVINSVIELAEWDVFAASAQWTGGYALNVDTGESRLGLSMEEAAGLAARANSSAHGIKLLMSRLDNSEKSDPVRHDRQIGLLHDLRRLYGGIPASLADSAGIFIGPKTHFNVVRAGVALLGVNPTPGAPNPLQPAFELRARIVQVRNMAAGETFAYDTSWAVRRPSRLALVSVGYADGYPRPAGPSDNALHAIVGGKTCRIAGRASMDLVAIDVTDLDPAAARRGEMVTLIGEGLGVDDLAKAVKSSGGEILVNLGRRFHRIYYASR